MWGSSLAIGERGMQSAFPLPTVSQLLSWDNHGLVPYTRIGLFA